MFHDDTENLLYLFPWNGILDVAELDSLNECYWYATIRSKPKFDPDGAYSLYYIGYI